MPTFYEFFAGAGMARAGLGKQWRCLFANDIDHKKAATYDDNWGEGAMLPLDVKSVTLDDLPESADLVWASFPCQDLSLAGAGAGLKGDRSGTFWPFWRLISKLADDGRAPTIVALENVAATLTSHGGKDFAALCEALIDSGYKIGARVIDAASFVPQSRPRLFIVAVLKDCEVPDHLVEQRPLSQVDKPVNAALERLDALGVGERVRDNWISWALPEPTKRIPSLESIIEENPADAVWHDASETKTLIDRMSVINRRKLEKAIKSGGRAVGTAYRRTRVEGGEKSVKTEVRFDGVAGCLRTPVGGSSRQIVIEVKDGVVRSRLMTTREGARLMGLPEKYRLPEGYNEGYHLVGDGVAVPVVNHLARSLFDQLVAANPRAAMDKAA